MDWARHAEVLRRLAASHVEFVVVGMTAGYEDLLDGRPRWTTLIELKEQAGRPKDLAALPVLRATLAETQARS